MDTRVGFVAAALLVVVACVEDSSAPSSSGSEPAANQACDRACQIAAANALFEGRGLEAARITVNGEVVAAADSWLGGAMQVHVHNTYADAARGQTVLVGTAQEADGRAAVFGLRAKIAAGAAEEIELLVAHEGEASLFPMEIPIATDAQFGELVPEDRRDSADTMIALANRYFDGIEASSDPELPVGDGCNRVENGVQTTRNPRFSDLRCNSLEPFVYIPIVEQRRFPVVDEERGVVVAVVVFQIPGGDYEVEVNGQKMVRTYMPRALYLFEAFKVADGRIHQIEATMRNLDHGATIDW